MRIVLDFDGTVTESDLLDRIARDFGDPAVYQEVEDGLDAGTMPLREVITREFAPVTAPLEEVVAWVLEHARVRAEFREFVDGAQAAGWEVHVVSSGFHELIEPVLEREGVDVLLHANRVNATSQGWQVDWRYPDDCDYCGESCKRALLPEGYVVYVGDGYSDRCAALASDRVFATSGLARYLAERGAPFEPFSDFRALSAALANAEGSLESSPVSEVGFDRLQHLITVPVSVNGIESRFILDSGIGLTLLRSELAESLGVRPTGASFTGRRMSGQSVTIPLGEVPTMTFAGSTFEQVEVGIFDMSSFPDELAGIGGFLSLAFFADRPLTVDYGRGVVIVETRETAAARYADGVPISVDVRRDGPSVTMFMPLSIPGGRAISVELDMGSDELILDERFADETGASFDGDGARRVEATDETGHAYSRRFTRLAGRIYPTAAPHLAQDDPDVMFQRIIHDGLVGDAFLRRHVVTFDVSGAAILLG